MSGADELTRRVDSQFEHKGTEEAKKRWQSGSRVNNYNAKAQRGKEEVTELI